MLQRGCRAWRGWDAPKGNQSCGGDAGLFSAAWGDPGGLWGAQELGPPTLTCRLPQGGEAALLPGCYQPALGTVSIAALPSPSALAGSSGPSCAQGRRQQLFLITIRSAPSPPRSASLGPV